MPLLTALRDPRRSWAQVLQLEEPEKNAPKPALHPTSEFGARNRNAETLCPQELDLPEVLDMMRKSTIALQQILNALPVSSADDLKPEDCGSNWGCRL